VFIWNSEPKSQMV